MIPTYAFSVTVQTDDNGTFLVTCPDVPELTTFGETEAEALAQAAAALVAVLDDYVADGRPLPPPGVYPGLPTVSLPTRVALKLALHDAMIETGTTQKALAEHLGMDPKQIRRMLDLTQKGLRPDDFDAALHALGRRPVLHLEAA